MRTIELNEIVEMCEEGTQSILIELIVPYKKQLLTYFEKYYMMDDPILMVTSIFNACQYGIIVPSCEFEEAMQAYFGDELDDDTRELVSFQSTLLNNL